MTDKDREYWGPAPRFEGLILYLLVWVAVIFLVCLRLGVIL